MEFKNEKWNDLLQLLFFKEMEYLQSNSMFYIELIELNNYFVVFDVFNCNTKQKQKITCAFVHGSADWDAKTHIAKLTHWSSNEPCDLCKVTKGNLASTSNTIKPQLRNEKFVIGNKAFPVCQLLPYCIPTYSFPLETMHVLYVGGIIPTVMNALFDKELLPLDDFFVCTLKHYSIN